MLLDACPEALPLVGEAEAETDALPDSTATACWICRSRSTAGAEPGRRPAGGLEHGCGHLLHAQPVGIHDQPAMRPALEALGDDPGARQVVLQPGAGLAACQSPRALLVRGPEQDNRPLALGHGGPEQPQLGLQVLDHAGQDQPPRSGPAQVGPHGGQVGRGQPALGGIVGGRRMDVVEVVGVDQRVGDVAGGQHRRHLVGDRGLAHTRRAGQQQDGNGHRAILTPVPAGPLRPRPRTIGESCNDCLE